MAQWPVLALGCSVVRRRRDRGVCGLRRWAHAHSALFRQRGRNVFGGVEIAGKDAHGGSTGL